MAHQLATKTNGEAAIAYVGATPWHGLGQRLESGQSIEQWTVSAGMDYTINRAFVRFNTDANGSPQQVLKDRVVLFRDDNKAPLGVVSDSYKVVQPSQVLEFFRDLVGVNGFELETAGVLFGGKKYWALASIGEQAEIVDRDRVGGYLLLSTSADGSTATTAKFTTVRVVCNNTLSMTVKRDATGDLRLSHRAVFNPDAVKDQLGIARDTFGRFITRSKRLAATPMTEERAGDVLETILKAQSGSPKSENVRESTGFVRIMDLFNGNAIGSDIDGVQGTAWGFINAITEYSDHHVKAATTDHRLASAWFGRGETLKSTAIELLDA